MTCAKNKKGDIRSFAKPLAFVLALLLIGLSSPALAEQNVTACGNLSTANTIYILNQSVNSTGTCFNILANNITLDGAGYTINYSQNETGYGINITNISGYTLITIKNITIKQENASVIDSYAIVASNMNASTITNNTIVTAGNNSGDILFTISYSNAMSNNNLTTFGTMSFGIYLNSSSNSNTISNNNITISGIDGVGILMQSSNSNPVSNNNIATSGSGGHGIWFYLSGNSNTFLNNSVQTSGINASGVLINVSDTNIFSGNNITVLGVGASGIAILASASNNITGGSIISAQSYDYYLSGSNFTNSFTNTNFTAKRSIYLNDSFTGFVYSNNSITLKTNISAQGNISRIITNWTSLLMKWNDTNSTLGVIAQYNISGLAASKLYYIFNTTGTARSNTTKMSDSNGYLNFSFNLTGNTEITVDAPPALTLISPLNDTLNYSTQSDTVSANLTLGDPVESCWYSNITNASYNNITMDSLTSTSWGDIISMPTGNTTYNTTLYCNDTNGNLGSTLRISFSRDDAPPTISSTPSAGTPTADSTTISWTLNERANCSVKYWNPEAWVLKNLTLNEYTTSCSVDLTSLTASKTYHYRVTSCDRAGNCLVEYPTPSDYTFTTAAAESTTTDDSSTTTQETTPNPLSKTWSSVSAGTNMLMTISSTVLDMTKITITAASAATNVKITLSKLSSKPSGVSAAPSSKIYQYIDITAENLPDSKISAASIFFKVTRAWLSANNVSSSEVILYRYSGGKWIALPTYPTVDSTTKYITYMADTAGFSHFAIGSSPITSTSQSTSNQRGNTTQNVSSSNGTAALNNTTSVGDGSSKSSKIFIYGVLIVVVAILSALVYYGKPQFESSKSNGYTFKPSSTGSSGGIVYKPREKKEKFRYEYKKN